MPPGTTYKRRKIPCSVCGLAAWVETDREKRPGHYSTCRSRNSCQCNRRQR